RSALPDRADPPRGGNTSSAGCWPRLSTSCWIDPPTADMRYITNTSVSSCLTSASLDGLECVDRDRRRRQLEASKKTSIERIDGIVALIMALGLAINDPIQFGFEPGTLAL